MSRRAGQLSPKMYEDDSKRGEWLVDATLSELAMSPRQPPSLLSWFSSPSPSEHSEHPPLPEGTVPKIGMDDFQKYFETVGTNLKQFELNSSPLPPQPLSRGERPVALAQPSSGLAQAMVEVPLPYFQEDFSIDWRELGHVDTPEQQQALVEELSSQLDRIETHLTAEIAARYGNLFEASVYLHELRADVHRLLEEVLQERRLTRSALEQTSAGSLTATTLSRRKAHLIATLQLSTAAQQVLQAKNALDSSLAAASNAGLDYIGTLEILEGLRESCQGQVVGLKAVGALPAYVASVAAAVKDIMVRDLIDRTAFDIQGCVAAILAEHSTTNSSNGNGSAALEQQPLDSKVPVVMGLCKAGSFDEALHAVLKDLQHGVYALAACLAREFLFEACNVEAWEVDASLTPASLAQALADVPADQFSALLGRCGSAFEKYFAHCDLVASSLRHALEQVTELSAPQRSKFSQHAAECHHRAVHAAVTCWGRLLTAWTSVAGPEKLGLRQLIGLLDATDAFATLAEIQAGKSVAILQTPIREACKAALGHLHAASIGRLTASLSQETWTYAPISAATAECLRLLLGQEQQPPITLAPPSQSTIGVGATQFRMIATVQVLIGVLQQYIEFCSAVPAFLADASQRVVELLRTFNSRTCQLILGAGAMQVAGLKSITVKHLAVSCHSVRAILALFPALTPRFVEPITGPRKNLVMKEFSCTSQDMGVHCSEVNNKIITIMCDRLTPVHDLPRLLASSAGAAAGSVPPSSIAVSTMKQLQILAGILTSTALPEDTQDILQKVVARFCAVLTAAYSSTSVQLSGLQQQAAVDLSYLSVQVNNLPLGENVAAGFVGQLQACLKALPSPEPVAAEAAESPFTAQLQAGEVKEAQAEEFLGESAAAEELLEEELQDAELGNVNIEEPVTEGIEVQQPTVTEEGEVEEPATEEPPIDPIVP